MTTAVRRPPARLGQELTERETQVIRGAANGLGNADIGRQLYLGEDTVKTHMRIAFQKLGATSRAHAVALALQQGVLTLRDIQPTNGTPGAPHRPPRAVQRVRALLADWRHASPPPPHLITTWWDTRLTQLANAIQEPTP